MHNRAYPCQVWLKFGFSMGCAIRIITLQADSCHLLSSTHKADTSDCIRTGFHCSFDCTSVHCQYNLNYDVVMYLVTQAATIPGHALTHAYNRKMQGTGETCEREGMAIVPLPHSDPRISGSGVVNVKLPLHILF